MQIPQEGTKHQAVAQVLNLKSLPPTRNELNDTHLIVTQPLALEITREAHETRIFVSVMISHTNEYPSLTNRHNRLTVD